MSFWRYCRLTSSTTVPPGGYLNRTEATIRGEAVGGRKEPKRKEPKRKSIAMTLMRDVQGTAAEKLAMFEKVRAAGGFANEHAADLAEAEKMLREFAAMERGSG